MNRIQSSENYMREAVLTILSFGCSIHPSLNSQKQLLASSLCNRAPHWLEVLFCEEGATWLFIENESVTIAGSMTQQETCLERNYCWLLVLCSQHLYRQILLWTLLLHCVQVVRVVGDLVLYLWTLDVDQFCQRKICCLKRWLRTDLALYMMKSQELVQTQAGSLVCLYRRWVQTSWNLGFW